ncbi:MAG TPA: family 1 glycosylhydrolase [Acidimicrobiales bacterium]|nr:family 1 glycosylhydrolase [Acidimicrobiales bacterium]
MDAPSPSAPWWGTAAAATQCEGAAPRSDWAGWEAEGRAPASRDGNGFRTRYADDLALLAEHGITHHRLTIEWARLEPSEGRWDEDEEAHLRRVLEAGRDAGVALWACLLHGSAPGWFTDDQRGWLDDKAATLTWPRHVDRVAEALGDLVAGWVPIHEPDLQARLAYGDGTFPPGRRSEDDERDARAALRAAEAEAARLLRGGGTPVAVAARLGEPHEGDDMEDLVLLSAPVDALEAPLEQTAEALPDAGIVVVTGDPTGEGRVERAVTAVRDAHRDGVRVVGAFHLPAMDGYEWHRGFDARLGLFDRDRNPKDAVGALPSDAD